MAEIPVTREPKRAFPWWLVVLLLAGVGVALYFLVFKKDEPARMAVATSTDASIGPAPVMPPSATDAGAAPSLVVIPPSDTVGGTTPSTVAGDNGEVLNDLVLIYGAVDRTTYADRRFEIPDVTVGRMISDRVFTVGTGDGEMYVMLDEALDRGSAEAAIQIKPGQKLSLVGKIARAPNAETADERMRGLSAEDATAMRKQGVYLQITRIGGAK